MRYGYIGDLERYIGNLERAVVAASDETSQHCLH